MSASIDSSHDAYQHLVPGSLRVLKIEMSKAEFILDLMELKHRRQHVSRSDKISGEEYCESKTWVHDGRVDSYSSLRGRRRRLCGSDPDGPGAGSVG